MQTSDRQLSLNKRCRANMKAFVLVFFPPQIAPPPPKPDDGKDVASHFACMKIAPLPGPITALQLRTVSILSAWPSTPEAWQRQKPWTSVQVSMTRNIDTRLDTGWLGLDFLSFSLPLSGLMYLVQSLCSTRLLQPLCKP